MSRIFFITGTSKGLGKALSEHYLSLGDTVVGCSRSEPTIVHENYLHMAVNVTDEAQVVGAIREVKQRFGRIDVLINNAGIASMNHLTMTPFAKAREIFSTNFLGSFLCLREISKVMVRQRHGRIINFSTVAVALNLEGEAVYAASKAAIESLTRIAAKELGDFNITVNAVGPTPIETDLIRNVPKDKIAALLQRQAVKRFGTASDLSNVIDFFIREESAFVTGQVLYLGGVSH